MSMRRPLLLPLVPLYAAGLGLKRQMSRWGWLKQRRLANPVISVGSVSAGGAGKTPMVLLLAEMLERGGYAVRILTRGYGRMSTGVERVEPEGDPRWFGDEPVLMARRAEKLGAEVFVGADRYEAGLVAEKRGIAGRRTVHVLDDGFQHGQLARDIDVVLLTRQDIEDWLLPAGNLRETLKSVHHADVIVLREDELEQTYEFVEQLAVQYGRRPLVWVVRRRLMLTGKDVLSKRPVVFSGIARPQNFVSMVEAEHCEPVATVAFEDHHAYAEQDVEKLVARAKLSGADGFVTTEKDGVKLTSVMRSRLETVGPVVVLRLHLELEDYKTSMTDLIGLVMKMERRGRRA